VLTSSDDARRKSQLAEWIDELKAFEDKLREIVARLPAPVKNPAQGAPDA